MLFRSDMVLCRVNAPLVKPCFALIRDGMKAVIRGRDIGSGLISTIAKMKASDIEDLIHRLTSYREREVAKLLIAKKDVQAQSIEDRVDTIIALTDGESTIDGVIVKINSVFSDMSKALYLVQCIGQRGLKRIMCLFSILS